MTTEYTRHRIGLVGSGIATSLSPALHAHEAAALGLDDYSYELVDLENLNISVEKTGEVVRGAVAGDFTGLNITHPCKQVVVDALDELSDNARLLGAVNTVVVDNGRLIGHNTDHSGFLTALQRGLPDAALDRVVLAGQEGRVPLWHTHSPPPAPRIFASQILIPLALPMCVLASPRPSLARAQRLWRSMRSPST